MRLISGSFLAIFMFLCSFASTCENCEKPRKIYVTPNEILISENCLVVNVKGIVVPVKAIHSDKNGFFVVESELMTNENSMADKGLYQCPRCGMLFESSRELRNHLIFDHRR